MAQFVLVHGGFFGGWCYRRLRDRLTEAGHVVYTPTLTGLGERSHLCSPTTDLTLHVQDVVNVILWEDLTELILCGHSYGGMVITGVAHQLSARIRALVYIDAVVPEAGEALIERLPLSARLHIDKALQDTRKPYMAPPSAAAWVNPADLEWVDSKLTPQPKATLIAPLTLTGEPQTIPCRAFIYAAAGLHEARHREFEGHPGCLVRGIEDTRHAIMIDQPQALADVLEEIDRASRLA